MMEEVLIPTNRGLVFGMAAGMNGAPLILGIHGWSQRNGWQTWQPLMEPLASAGYRVICLDMPGWGRSEAWGSGPLSESEGIEAILAVHDYAEANRATIMGKSWGGGLAIRAALNHPERVERLVLTAPAFREPGKLNALQQPAILAWAEDDPVIPYQYASYYVEAVPNIVLVTYPTGGHSAGPNNAEDFAAQVITFLGSTEKK